MNYYLQETIDLSDDAMIFRDDGNSTGVSELIITQVTSSSRGYYTCSITYTIPNSDFQVGIS